MTRTVSREDAVLGGLKWYFTGIPCCNGHVAPRQVVNYTCKECMRVRAALPKSKKKMRSWTSTYRTNPVIRQKHNDASLESYHRNSAPRKASVKEWRKRNPTLTKAYSRSHYHRHKAEMTKRLQEWRVANRDKQCLQNIRRRALEHNAIDTLTATDIKLAFEKQCGLCAGIHCRIPMGHKYTIDHKTPFFRGGNNTPDNIQLLCKPCNSSKGIRTMEEWLEWLFQASLVAA